MAEFIQCCMPMREDQKPIITISTGKITGQLRETSKNIDYISFTSIPYAEPPIGIIKKTNFLKEKQICNYLPTMYFF